MKIELEKIDVYIFYWHFVTSRRAFKGREREIERETETETDRERERENGEPNYFGV